MNGSKRLGVVERFLSRPRDRRLEAVHEGRSTMPHKIKLPSPALVISLLALFVALSGTAVAAGVVPLAQRALTADDAKKLGGRTAAQVASLPGPATSAAGVVSVKTVPFALGPDSGRDFTVSCDAGQRAIAGGFDSDGSVFNFDMRPVAGGTAWAMYLANPDEAAGASGNAYAICVR